MDVDDADEEGVHGLEVELDVLGGDDADGGEAVAVADFGTVLRLVGQKGLLDLVKLAPELADQRIGDQLDIGFVDEVPAG